MSIKSKRDPGSIVSTQGAGQTHCRFRKNETIFVQGDPAGAVFYVRSGQVKISVVSAEGKEAIIAVLGPDEFFGEAILAGLPRRRATVTAITECNLTRLEKEAVIRLLHNDPSFSDMFLSHIVLRNIKFEEAMLDLLVNSSEKRLARALLLLSNFGQANQSERVMFNVSQEMLAEMIGTTRARVSSLMNKFKRRGLIDYNGGIEVRSSLLDIILRE